MKYTYRLVINDDDFSGKRTITYPFANNKVDIIVKKGMANATTVIGRDYSKVDITSTYVYKLMRDAISRINIIHTLKYGKSISINSLILYEYLDDEEICKKELTAVINCFFSYGTLIGKIPETLNNEGNLKKVVSNYKTKQAGREAAINAYLFSKTKLYPPEKFIYLWMTLSGMYNCMFKKDKESERATINKLLQYYNLGNEISTSKVRGKIAVKIRRLLDQSGNADSILAQLKNPNDNILKNKMVTIFEENKLNDIQPYGYIITDYAYYYRCNIYHANKPLPLSLCRDDADYKSITVINKLLEEFLDDKLVNILKEEERNDETTNL